MPCSWYKTADGTVIHVNHGRGGGRKKKCPFCKREDVEKLCDFPVGNGKTCDAEICRRCSTTIGTQNLEIAAGFTKMGETVDVCPIHRNQQFPKDGK